MEVVARTGEFHFGSACTSPYGSNPSSPPGFAGRNFYTSAPTTPTHAAAIYRHIRCHQSANTSAIPFDWEDTPGTPKHRGSGGDDKEENPTEPVDFAFEFSGQVDSGSSDGQFTATADELFEAGKIRPLTLPPRLQQVPSNLKAGAGALSPRSPKSPTSPISHLFRSPRRREEDDDFDPFEKAIQETIRGRERTNSIRGNRRVSRSLSPFRNVFDCAGSSSTITTDIVASADKSSKPANPSANHSRGGKKWRLRDLLLFRSASEGRAIGRGRKDPTTKHTAALLSPPSLALLSKGSGDDGKSSSFRSTDSGGSSRRGASAHEVHYTENRAASLQLKRKTPLPYRSGLLGWLGFNPVPSHGKGS